ncbi:MAG: hypothetical protein CBE43_06995 [Rhodopirellula sp. TMED283]|nr:MAG: hypothetical protein CBE43_06995 [Rhodopirellula sp. TMED283]
MQADVLLAHRHLRLFASISVLLLLNPYASKSEDFSAARQQAGFVGFLQSSSSDCRCRVVATFPIEPRKFRILAERLHHG